MASQFFRYFRDDNLDVMRFQGNDFQRDFTLVSGTYLELWMLKVLWGAIEAKAMEIDIGPQDSKLRGLNHREHATGR
jgi:hypothetical protein